MPARSRLGSSNPLAAALAEAAPSAPSTQRTTFSVSRAAGDLARDAAHHLRVPVVEFVEQAIRRDPAGP